MPKRYTPDEKSDALGQLSANNGDLTYTSTETGIPPETLRRWWKQQQAQPEQQLQQKLTHLRQQLVENALMLAEAMEDKIENAPLNQLASAMGTVLDRYLKLDEHLTELEEENEEKVIRIEYKYPDGSIHNTPPWANDDYEDESTFPGGGVWQKIRENADRQAGNYPNGAGREDLLVDSPDLPDGESGLAGFKNGFAGYSLADD